MKNASLLLCTTLLAACAVGPDYTEPQANLPAWWHAQVQKDERPQDSAGPSKQEEQPQAWWCLFHDAELDSLIEKALQNNHSLKIAEARIAEERGARQDTASALYPQISASANSTRGNQTTAQASAFIPSGLNNNSDNPKPVTVSQTAFDVSWELDIFGGTRRLIEAENARVAGYEADLRSVQLTLIGDVAQNYFFLRELQEQEEIILLSSKAQTQLSAIAERKYKAGTGSRFEFSQADTLVQSMDARLPELKRQEEMIINQLSTLIAEPIGTLSDHLKQSKPLPQPIAIPALQAPADAIRQRPDVQAAERQLAAATAMQGAAIAEAYPKVSLSSLFGVLSTSLTDPVQIWSYTGGAAASLLTFGRIEGQINAADARQQKAFHQYQQSILTALADIETQLQNVAQSNARTIKLEKAAKSAKNTVTIARDRYRHGTSSMTDVLTAEQQFYSADSDRVSAEAERLNYLVALHKALGLLPSQKTAVAEKAE